MPKQDNPHDGHRERLREKYIKADLDKLDKFPPHEILELLLFYVMPRVNTNEIAHRLLDTFGSIDAVFDADIHELEKVDGIGNKSAIFLNLISATFRVYANAKNNITNKVITSDNIGEYVKSLFYARMYETLFMISVDTQNRVISTDIICHGSISSVNIDMRKLISVALRNNAAGIILAHNHPGGKALPSAADREATEMVRNILSAINIRLLDHIIVAGNEYVSMNFDLHMLN